MKHKLTNAFAPSHLGQEQQAAYEIRNGVTSENDQIRRDHALGKVKEKTDLGVPYDAALREIQNNFPHLFEGPKERAARMRRVGNI
ncbi:MAG TPA: hypothetical protein VL981_06205 [Candidatus Methylacidiphilales bacterium]|nr:hypothetical protein [Candidatus Methylacidiphilales bacterium]